MNKKTQKKGARKLTPWNKLVKDTMKKNPTKKFGDVLKIASKRMKKGDLKFFK